MITETTVKKKTATKKWTFTHDEYLNVLEVIDSNTKTITQLLHDVKKLKTRLGI